MPGASLSTLLDRNRSHVESLADDYFAAVRDAQRPPVVSLCCSDSRVSQEGMWDVDEPGWLFTPSNIGNQARDGSGGDLVVDGSVLYPIVHADTETVVVVGHTGCGAVTAAYETVVGDGEVEHPGVRERIELLVPVVEAGLERDAIAADAPRDAVVDRLVEYNVDRQVAFLREHETVPDGVDVYGFVYDLHETYADVPGRTYLVNANGTTDPGQLAAQLSDGYEQYVRSLL